MLVSTSPRDMVPRRTMKVLKRLKLTLYKETVIDNSLLGKG